MGGLEVAFTSAFTITSISTLKHTEGEFLHIHLLRLGAVERLAPLEPFKTRKPLYPDVPHAQPRCLGACLREYAGITTAFHIVPGLEIIPFI